MVMFHCQFQKKTSKGVEFCSKNQSRSKKLAFHVVLLGRNATEGFGRNHPKWQKQINFLTVGLVPLNSHEINLQLYNLVQAGLNFREIFVPSHGDAMSFCTQISDMEVENKLLQQLSPYTTKTMHSPTSLHIPACGISSSGLFPCSIPLILRRQTQNSLPGRTGYGATIQLQTARSHHSSRSIQNMYGIFKGVHLCHCTLSKSHELFGNERLQSASPPNQNTLI